MQVAASCQHRISRLTYFSADQAIANIKLGMHVIVLGYGVFPIKETCDDDRRKSVLLIVNRGPTLDRIRRTL
jgi:hypothetical protein